MTISLPCSSFAEAAQNKPHPNSSPTTLSPVLGRQRCPPFCWREHGEGSLELSNRLPRRALPIT